MKIVIGGDHVGYPLKARLIDKIRALGHDVTDMGCFDENPVDFPDIARLVCAAASPADISSPQSYW
jgi:Ribose 5-phosphate isomerase RpiB